MTTRMFRTSLVCSLVTGFAFEPSTSLSELAELASHVLHKDIQDKSLVWFGSGVRMNCMAAILPIYPNLPTELDVVKKGVDQCLAEAIELYGPSLEI